MLVSILFARENYATLEINPKLELNSDFASGGEGKNKGRQSETLTSFIIWRRVFYWELTHS